MAVLPLIKRLRRQAHKDIAFAQDILLVEIYNHFLDAIIHGGTAIWRVYGSNRFSEDVDIYLPKKYRMSQNIQKFMDSLKNRGFTIAKFREKENSIFSTLPYANAVVRFEAVFSDMKNFVVKPLEMADGNFINVYTLSPEDLLLEKISAYSKRKKVRDLYDIYFLLKLAEEKAKILPVLKDFIKKFEPPRDSSDMKILIISGAIPSVKDMIEEIERWVKQNILAK